jgi:hypothetical protein
VAEPENTAELDQVIEEIRAAVAANTAAGVYPPDLEDQLQSHYARLLERSDGRDRFDSARAAVSDVAEAAGMSRSRIDTRSSVPGGQLVHRAVGKAVSRQVIGISEQFNQFASALVPALSRLVDLAENPRAHSHDDLVHELDTVQDRLAAVERSLDRILGLVDRVSETLPRVLAHTNQLDGLSARLDALEEAARRGRFSPDFPSIEFDAVSRGDEGSIREEYSGLADSLVGVPGPVIDVGAGRGEFLELLRERGVPAWGVELEADLVAYATKRDLDVRLQDGIEALAECDAGSLGGVVLLHVVEHLGKNELLDVISLARSRLASGGKLVIETPNPQSLYVYARAFYLDPTHSQPVHPIYVDFLLRRAGFDRVEFEWTAPPSDAERLAELPGDDAFAKTANENVRRLNDLVFAPQNYRVIATR